MSIPNTIQAGQTLTPRGIDFLMQRLALARERTADGYEPVKPVLYADATDEQIDAHFAEMEGRAQ